MRRGDSQKGNYLALMILRQICMDHCKIDVYSVHQSIKLDDFGVHRGLTS